ncbi:hypothetical protein H072_2008 [Dactylellina haptotyla CBS 200.50]|uniref:HMA domain-containing protein n=1 Tax=Dactylellina haptotyla (strain CBS 200.50) TaxID=1284197 RepID=S8AM18_DACHA|nr:hypothetical protein H072_2008 [Dactylellina haptotyla CBS 200.50]
MATNQEDKIFRNVSKLRSKLKTTSLENALWELAKVDIEKIECCKAKNDLSLTFEGLEEEFEKDLEDVLRDIGCYCTDNCWETFAAILCKYNIHDTEMRNHYGRRAMPYSYHEKHEKDILAANISGDLSFMSDKSDSECCGSICHTDTSWKGDPEPGPNQICYMGLMMDLDPEDSDYIHLEDDTACSDTKTVHRHECSSESSDSSVHKCHSVHEQQNSSITEQKSSLESNDPYDHQFPEALKPALHGLTHSIETKHHHHYNIQSIQGACTFHKELAQIKRHKGHWAIARCPCAWIKGVLLLIFENQQVAHICCKTRPEGTLAVRTCCLEGHSPQDELGDSVESLPSETCSLVPAKALKYLALGVTGMTCTTCEWKLSKCLKKIKGVIPKGSKGVKTNFMLGRAEVWYDSEAIIDPTEEICDVVHKKTGFKCKVLRDTTGGGSSNHHNIHIKVKLPDDITSNTITNHIVRLEGVKKVKELTLPKEKETFRSKFLGIFKSSKDHTSTKTDPEKGMVGQVWRLLSITYDQQILNIRDLLQYIKAVSRVPSTVEIQMEELEEPEFVIAQESRLDLRRLLSYTLLAAFLTLPILIITWTPSIKTQVPEAHDMDFGRVKNYIILQTVCFILALAVQTIGYEIYQNAFRSVFRQRRLDMDCLIAISTTAAFIYSAVYYSINVLREFEKLDTRIPPTDIERERHDPIFEASSLLITLILAGRLLTGYIRHWAANRISVGSLQAKYCVRSHQGTFRPIRNRRWIPEDVRLLHYGDVLLVGTGEIAVTDGVVVNGEATVDESHLTGEAEPAQLQRNATIIAGSKIIEGRLEYRVTRLVPENTISSMKKLVTAASGKRPKMQEYADKLAAWLTPAVLIIALLACICWAVYYRTAKAATEDINSAITKSLTVAITILAISCPCAIALAVPTVLIFSTQVGVKHGIVIKSPEILEKANKIRYFVADKTGTLTTGKLQVAAAKYWVNGEWVDDITSKGVQELQLQIYKLIARDQHPVAKAVLENLKQYHTKVVMLPESNSIKTVVGKGIEGTFDGRRLKGGKPSWVLQDKIKNFSKAIFEEVVEKVSRTPFVVVDIKTNAVLAIFGLTDTIRLEAASVIRKLQAQNIECFLLSGDQINVCLQVAEALGIPPENVQGECSPEDKVYHIRDLQTRCKMFWDISRLSGCVITRFIKRFRTGRNFVVFLGDGTNDAPALTQADIGIAMSNCTDIAAGCADAGIISNSLNGVLALVALSNRAMSLIQCNFGWALKYNIGAILLSLGIFPWRIAPQYAGIGEAVSVAPVFIIASSILWWKLKY